MLGGEWVVGRIEWTCFRHLQDTIQTLYGQAPDTLQTTFRHPLDTFQTSSRYPLDKLLHPLLNLHGMNDCLGDGWGCAGGWVVPHIYIYVLQPLGGLTYMLELCVISNTVENQS